MDNNCGLSATAAQLDICRMTAGPIDWLITRHERSRREWLPAELLDRGEDDDLAALKTLRDRAKGLSPAIKVAVMLNLLTEEGLPHFYRIISEHVGDIDVWQRWSRLWTAEEDRHGNVMRDYVRDAALFSVAELDRMQFQFMRAGFNPSWGGSPYRLLAYTSLQERATQAAHANTARLAASVEPVLQRMLAHLAGDEARHCAFYSDAFALMLGADPDGALIELETVASALSMPGETIPGYLMMSEVERRAGIFGPREYADIVRERLAHWRVNEAEPESGPGREAQERLMALPDRLGKLADRLENRSRRKTFEFDFMQGAVEMA